MIGRLSAAAVLSLLIFTPHTAAIGADEFPNVVGVWSGTFNTAFSKPNKRQAAHSSKEGRATSQR